MADPQFVAPIVDWLVSVLQSADLGGLAPFAEVKKSWTGVVLNWPPVSVGPRTSEFDPEIQGASHSENLFTVKFGVQDQDPEQLAVAAMAYMAAVDLAIETAARLPQISRVFVQSHDYGVLFEKDGSFAKFPSLHLLVEVYE